MAHSPPPLHGPSSKRPKGILKTSSSYLRSPTHKPVDVPVDGPPPSAVTITDPVTEEPSSSSAATNSDLTERDIVLQNTLQNAGRRRSSSNMSRRTSHHESDPAAAGSGKNPAEVSPRLKWDEANLYLTEQERTPKMKIDEPKTPFAKGYDPAEDEAELRMLDAEDIVVDELDSEAGKKAGTSHRHTPNVDVPDLDIGEPEEAAPELKRRESHSPKQVQVREEDLVSAEGHHHVPGDDPETPEEEEKHRKFEEMRKKHYEMKNVANLLGHPEYLEEEDDDGDVALEDAPNGTPEVPSLPQKAVNGDKDT